MANGSVITTNGRKVILNRSFKSSPDYTVPSQFEIGVANETPLIGDTTLDVRVPITGTESVDDCDTDDWSDGTDTTATLNNTTYKQGDGSISVAKSGSSGTTFSVNKATTSRDFTSKDLWMWVYFTDITDLVSSGTAMTIKFGSDNSNYYYLDIGITSLADGWNYISFSSSTATGTTGSPVITACDYTEIIFNTDLAADTVAADRVLIDDVRLASSDDYKKTITSGYPTFDETLLEVEKRGTLLSTEAVGFNINAFATFNTDSTPLMCCVDVFTAESKSTTDEFVFIDVDELEE